MQGTWKVELLRWLGQTFTLRVLVETGTCEGRTLAALAHDFREIYSVELSPHYHAIASQRLARYRHIRLWKGTSPECLPDMLRYPQPGPILFWLDAHHSGGKTAAGDPDPLARELEIICRERPDSLIVIDDESEPDLKRVVAAGVDLSGWVREYRCGIILMHRGVFRIPAFENQAMEVSL